jgi:hypothetical protein
MYLIHHILDTIFILLFLQQRARLSTSFVTFQSHNKLSYIIFWNKGFPTNFLWKYLACANLLEYWRGYVTWGWALSKVSFCVYICPKRYVSLLLYVQTHTPLLFAKKHIFHWKYSFFTYLLECEKILNITSEISKI